MVPAISVLYRDWMPPGPERAFALAIPELGSKISMVLSPLTVPWLAARNGGWTSVAVAYGVGCAAFGALWHACAADTAADWHSPGPERSAEAGVVGRLRALLLPGMNAAERQMLRSSAADEGEYTIGGGLARENAAKAKLQAVFRSQALLLR